MTESGEVSLPISVTVEEGDAGNRLDVFVAEHLEVFSRARIARAIQAGRVTVNSVCVKQSQRMAAGDVVVVQEFAEEADGPVPENIPLEIIFEDEELVVVNKPADMVVHPSRGHWSGTLASAVSFHCEQLSGVGGPTRPGIVHRLDRDTTGVILIAKNDRAHQCLSEQFQARRVEKVYVALVAGRLDHDRDVVRAPIGPHGSQRTRMAVRREGKGVREAESYYEVVERYGRFAQVQVKPKTGRTHQIRVHLAHVGAPVICDRLYGQGQGLTVADLTGLPDATGRVVIQRQGLHARSIACEHPVTGQTMKFEAPLPEDMREAIECLQQRTR